MAGFCEARVNTRETKLQVVISGIANAIFLLALWACSYDVKTSSQTSLELRPNETVAVVSHGGAPEEIAQCVGDALRAHMPDANILSSDAFRTSFFPWFEPTTAPVTASDFQRLMARNVVMEKLNELRIRYIVAVGGGTTEEGGAGCFGQQLFICWSIWDKATHLTASILDPQRHTVEEAVEANVEGTSWGVWVILPLGAPAPTEFAACDEVGERLANVFAPSASEL